MNANTETKNYIDDAKPGDEVIYYRYSRDTAEDVLTIDKIWKNGVIVCGEMRFQTSQYFSSKQTTANGYGKTYGYIRAIQATDDISAIKAEIEKKKEEVAKAKEIAKAEKKAQNEKRHQEYEAEVAETWEKFGKAAMEKALQNYDTVDVTDTPDTVVSLNFEFEYYNRKITVIGTLAYHHEDIYGDGKLLITYSFGGVAWANYGDDQKYVQTVSSREYRMFDEAHMFHRIVRSCQI